MKPLLILAACVLSACQPTATPTPVQTQVVSAVDNEAMWDAATAQREAIENNSAEARQARAQNLERAIKDMK